MSATPSTVSTSALTQKALSSRATLQSVGWVPERDLDLSEWSQMGQQLSVMNRCSPWWLGDWIRYGNTRFGEKYSRAANITAYDVQTLMNMVYVASRFDIARRRKALSWSHHETVASLEPAKQDRWLDLAAEHKMSVADLRLELRSRQRSDERASNGGDDVEGDPETSVACPNCGQPIPRSLFTRSRREFSRRRENRPGA